MQIKVYRFGEAGVSNVDTPRGKHFSSVATMVRTFYLFFFIAGRCTEWQKPYRGRSQDSWSSWIF